MTETKEQRKKRLDKARAEYRLKISEWALKVEAIAAASSVFRTSGLSDEEELALEVAAQLLRSAKIAQVKRAVSDVRRVNKYLGQLKKA